MRSKASARSAPMSREVECHQLLVCQCLFGGGDGTVKLVKLLSFKMIHFEIA